MKDRLTESVAAATQFQKKLQDDKHSRYAADLLRNLAGKATRISKEYQA